MVASVVLVTGGSGFLGQHIVKHLQLYSSDVKEIRVLDVIPYKNRLDYEGKIPVYSFTGSVANIHLVNEACRGTDAVIHVASLIDNSMFPNKAALDEINVKGTEVILDACKANNIQHLIYCSSISVFVGFNEIKDGTEKTVPIPHKFMFEEYASSKFKAQKIVLHANGDVLKNGKELKTCAILPLAMYGELDRTFVYQYVQSFRGKFIMRAPRLGKMDAHVQLSYVGNVAMMFVNAFEAMRRGDDIGGEYFYAADDTPVETVPKLLQPYFGGTKYDVTSWYVPLWIMVVFVFFVYCIFSMVRPLKKVNTKLTIDGIYFMNQTFYVTYDKAKTMLGYMPLYDWPSAITKSNKYYAGIV